MLPQPTQHAHVNLLLNTLLAKMRPILGEKLLGLYLYGSLTVGGFDSASDVDTVAILREMLTEEEFSRLDAMHGEIVAQLPQWNNRIEIIYATQQGIQTYDTHISQQAVISPGEPFHIVEAGQDWVMNWYFVREYGITLYGAAPQTLIPPIPKAVFLQAAYDTADEWEGRMGDLPGLPWQSYSILTLCRAYYTVTHGEHVSKQDAAEWVSSQLPQYAPQIQQALEWRMGTFSQDDDSETTLLVTQKLLRELITLIQATEPS
ncbi:MAG: DUF4111 domain-containing protein [Anaerolineae bacterium]|nr:DUF4111 domain-containing protein [Anaerolineae bacterium]